jgi:hypothetical protein
MPSFFRWSKCVVAKCVVVEQGDVAGTRATPEPHVMGHSIRATAPVTEWVGDATPAPFGRRK